MLTPGRTGAGAGTAMLAQMRLKLMQTEQWLAASQADAQRNAAECRMQSGAADAMREELEVLRSGKAETGEAGGDRLVVRTIEPSKLQLAPELKQEVDLVRKEWTSSTNALSLLAQAEAVSAVAECTVLRAELSMMDEQLQQARLMAEQDRRAIKEQAVREEELGRRIDLMRTRSRTRTPRRSKRARSQMEGARATELHEALIAAERNITETKEDREATVKAVNEMRNREAGRARRARQGLEEEARRLLGGGDPAAMDIRVYVNNEPVFRALMDGLLKEEELLERMDLQTKGAGDETRDGRARARLTGASGPGARSRRVRRLAEQGQAGDPRAGCAQLRAAIGRPEAAASRRSSRWSTRRRWWHSASGGRRRRYRSRSGSLTRRCTACRPSTWCGSARRCRIS